MLAITGNREGLADLRVLVQGFECLADCREEAEEHVGDLELFNRIRETVRSKPSVLKNRMKTELGMEDGRRVGRLVSYLKKAERSGGHKVAKPTNFTSQIMPFDVRRHGSLTELSPDPTPFATRSYETRSQ